MSVEGVVVSVVVWCACWLWVVVPASPGRAGALPESRLRSTPMPEPFSAIRDVAASRRRALGAQARTSANGRGIDVLRGWFVEALWGTSLALLPPS